MKAIIDNYSGCKQGFAKDITDINCIAHARRKLVDHHVANKSQIADRAVENIEQLYEVEREARSLTPETQWHLRQARSRPIADVLHQWM
ncbi:transposase [Amphritea atlantica]|uniref:Transposase n=1 Tax=Amphritea atlantica TaxID=355243 RepID=A0ABY5GU93_9GAMM|nr:transposase [Amphritea atlantica]